MCKQIRKRKSFIVNFNQTNSTHNLLKAYNLPSQIQHLSYIIFHKKTTIIQHTNTVYKTSAYNTLLINKTNSDLLICTQKYPCSTLQIDTNLSNNVPIIIHLIQHRKQASRNLKSKLSIFSQSMNRILYTTNNVILKNHNTLFTTNQQ